MKNIVKIINAKKKNLKFLLPNLVQEECYLASITSINGASKVFNIGS